MFMGQDLKDKIHKSILTVVETAFQEEVCRCPIDKSRVTPFREMTILNTAYNAVHD